MSHYSNLISKPDRCCHSLLGKGLRVQGFCRRLPQPADTMQARAYRPGVTAPRQQAVGVVATRPAIVGRCRRSTLAVRSVAEAERSIDSSKGGMKGSCIVDNAADGGLTQIRIEGVNRPGEWPHPIPALLFRPAWLDNCTCAAAGPAGLLGSLASTFTDLGLDVVRAEIGSKGGSANDVFYVTTVDGRKVADDDIASIKQAIEVTLASSGASGVGIRPKVAVPGAAEDRQDLLHSLMGEQLPSWLAVVACAVCAGWHFQALLNAGCGCSFGRCADTYVRNDVLSIQQSIVNRE